MGIVVTRSGTRIGAVRLAAALVAFAVMLPASRANAQQLRGTVSDSSSTRPIPGAVVLLLDAGRATIARTVTNERGQFSLLLDGSVRSARVLRIGFRARELPVTDAVRSSGRLDIAMVTIPALLERMTVLASPRCPQRDDAQQAYSLLEQARAGLLATVVARESRPASLKLIAFDRTMDGGSDRIESQKVRIDSTIHRTKSFEAVADAGVFVTDGFARDSNGTRQFFGPEAETLLSEAFLSGYCIRLERAGRDRPNQVGLGFSVAEARKPRVDIDGVLWVDTAAKSLRDFEFRYTGLEHVRGIQDPGGHIWFREMPNGVVLIDRWFLRLYGGKTETQYTASGRQMDVMRYFNRESGGEIARAIWPDGVSWKGPLGTIYLHVTDSTGKPATHVIVRLTDTDYIGSPDREGNLEFADVLPGPYGAEVIDAEPSRGGLVIGTPLRVWAERDSLTRLTLIAPPRAEFQRRTCVYGNATWITVQALQSGKPVAAAQWDVGEDLGTKDPFVTLGGVTDEAGKFSFCHRAAPGIVTQVRVRATTEPERGVVVTLLGKKDLLTVELPPQ